MNLQVYVYTRPNLLKLADHGLSMVGVGTLERLFNDNDLKNEQGKNVNFLYPERFLNTAEQTDLINRLESAKYDNVTIVTNSPFIIQNVLADQINICYPEGIEEIKKCRTFGKMSHDDIGTSRHFKMGKINIKW